MKTTSLRLQVVRQTQPSQNLGQEQSNGILRQRATQNQLCPTDHMEREINLTMQAPLHIVTKRQGSDLANSWNPFLKRSTHEWHEFGQAPKHLVLMCCYSMRCMEKKSVCVFPFFWPCFNFFCSFLHVFNMFMFCTLGYAFINKYTNINCLAEDIKH